MVTTLVDMRLSPESHAWVMSDQERERITRPLARIAARHTPMVGGQEANDVMDVLDAGLGLVGYGLRARTTAILAEQEQHHPGFQQ